MDDHDHELRTLASRCAQRECVLDAWVAKSFTDLLLVLEVAEGDTLSADIREWLAEQDLVGYNELHDVAAADPASAGELPDRDRYRFVSLDSRGRQQSYVVE